MSQIDPRLREHAVWCRGQHNDDSECLIAIPVDASRDAAQVRLIGIPEDNQYIELQGDLHHPADIDAAIAALTHLRPLVVDQERVEELLAANPDN